MPIYITLSLLILLWLISLELNWPKSVRDLSKVIPNKILVWEDLICDVALLLET